MTRLRISLFLAIAVVGACQDETLGAAPRRGEQWTVPGLGMEFVWIDALGGWVGKYEVTNAEFRFFQPTHDSGSKDAYSLDRDRQPAVCVSYPSVVSFCDWLSEREKKAKRLPRGCRYRLPNGSEWLTFAQCGDGRKYPWGNRLPPTYRNYNGQEGADAAPRVKGHIDRYPVSCPVDDSGMNDWGLYGVGGNVWEWTPDLRKGKYRYVWGSSWGGLFQGRIACDTHFSVEPSTRNSKIGFRVMLAQSPGDRSSTHSGTVSNRAPSPSVNELTDFRTWTDKKGRTLTARIHDASHTHVWLEKRGGKIAKINRASLSQEDQEVVQWFWSIVSDPGMVAQGYIRGKMAEGVIRSAQFLGYQKGMATPIIAVYRCNYVSRAGVLMVGDFCVALTRRDGGSWGVLGFDQAGLSPMLPVHQDWRRVVHPIAVVR